MTNAFDWMGGADVPAQDLSPEEILAANEKMASAAAEVQMDFAKLVFDVMEASPRGAELMQRLEDLTIQMPLMQVSGSLVTGEVALSPADWAYVREGQNSVVRMLKDQIAYAKSPPKELEPKDGNNE